ncbi:hypothetical protein AUP68_17866 [Ilyonectria robusta]
MYSRAKTGSDDGGGKGLPKAKIELLEGASLMALYGGGGSRSASPRKREASSPKDECEFDEYEEKSAKEALDDDWYAEHLELVLDRESPRGRKRQRASNSLTTDMTTPPLAYSPASNGSIGTHDVLCYPARTRLRVDLSTPILDEITSTGPLTKDNTDITNTGILRGCTVGLATQYSCSMAGATAAWKIDSAPASGRYEVWVMARGDSDPSFTHKVFKDGASVLQTTVDQTSGSAKWVRLLTAQGITTEQELAISMLASGSGCARAEMNYCDRIS